MLRAAFLAVLALGGSAAAQAPAALRFQWQKGQALDYRVTQTTVVRETTLDGKDGKPVETEVRTALELTKRWTVADVDAAGTGTLELSVSRLRQEIRQPDGKATAIDSANADDAKQMAEYLNKTVLTLRVDGRGRVLEVRETKPGTAGRISAELPFRAVLPEAAPTAGQAWSRAFAIKLDPPHGTGESYDATQSFTFKGTTADGLAAIGVETALKAPPKTAGERVPLVPLLWCGDVYVRAEGGRYRAARLTAKAELEGHQGTGTKFSYESTYAEDAVEKR